MDTAAIAEAITRQGWYVIDQAFSTAQVDALASECRSLEANSQLLPATTGHDLPRSPSVLRGDRTRWFEPAALSAAQSAYWQHMDGLRVNLNHALLLGLHELEAHYALYPPGSGYARHRDRFRDDDARVLSSVLYLNSDWHADDGGALRLYLDDGEHDIAPNGGRLALFLSAQIEHEVLPAQRERLSIAGWFRQRELTR
jgi:SM-20-related protein